MFSLLRLLQRSGGVLAMSIALLGLAFYGIALLSVAMVDDPGRGLRILAVFGALSVVFCALLVWMVRRAIAHARRPLDSAYEATARIASMGGKGGREAFQFLGRKTSAAGGYVASLAGLIGRSASFAGRWAFRAGSIWPRRERNTDSPAADVIPLRRPRKSRSSGGR